MYMKADLHIHSVFSGDSTLSVQEIFRRATSEGLSAVAITDHDSVDAIPQAMSVAKEASICLVPGVEVSCSFAGYLSHLLMFSDCIDHSGIREFLDGEVFEAKRRNVVPIIEALAEAGLPVSMDGYDEEVSSNGKGGSPLEGLLQQKGIIKDAAEYTRKIAPLIPPEAIRNDWGPPVERAISVAHECGATAVLAHPRGGGPYGKLGEDELDEIRHMGIDGLEAYHSSQSNEEQQAIHKYCTEHRLLVTGGSDCHGNENRNVGQPGLEIPSRRLPSVIHLKDLLKGNR